MKFGHLGGAPRHGECPSRGSSRARNLMPVSHLALGASEAKRVRSTALQMSVSACRAVTGARKELVPSRDRLRWPQPSVGFAQGAFHHDGVFGFEARAHEVVVVDEDG